MDTLYLQKWFWQYVETFLLGKDVYNLFIAIDNFLITLDAETLGTANTQSLENTQSLANTRSNILKDFIKKYQMELLEEEKVGYYEPDTKRVVLLMNGMAVKFDVNDWGCNTREMVQVPNGTRQVFRCEDYAFVDENGGVEKFGRVGIRHVANLPGEYGNVVMMITEDGNVLVTGYGSGGKLGLRDTDLIDIIVPIPCFLSDKIKIVSCATGQLHALYLTEDGGVYACGGNRHGQLGMDVARCRTPQKIVGLKNIVQIMAVENTSYCLTIAGQVLVFGMDCFGRIFKTPVLDERFIECNVDCMMWALTKIGTSFVIRTHQGAFYVIVNCALTKLEKQDSMYYKGRIYALFIKKNTME